MRVLEGYGDHVQRPAVHEHAGNEAVTCICM